MTQWSYFKRRKASYSCVYDIIKNIIKVDLDSINANQFKFRKS